MSLTVIELEALQQQIRASQAIADFMPRIAAHLETIAVTVEALLDDNFTPEAGAEGIKEEETNA